MALTVWLSIRIPRQSGQSLYAGLDYGRLWGPSAPFLAGTQLAGVVVGLRGSIASEVGTFGYDLFIGTPVYKPAAFPASGVTAGFQVFAKF